MTARGDPSAAAGSPRRSIIEDPLVALWLLLPACIWWTDFGAPWVRPGSPSWRWSPVLAALAFWLFGTAYAALRRPARSFDSGPGPDLARPILFALGTIAYLLLGASFLIVLGPGIAPVRSPLARGLVGALMIACAWTGWTALHPGARRPALRILARLLRRS